MIRSTRYALALAVALAALGICACASTTPYQPLSRGEGYSEQKLEANRYRIAFAGNSSTPRRTIENYVLYRAAELTLDNGFDYFVLSGTTRDRARSGVGVGFGGFSIGSSGGVGVGVGASSGSNGGSVDQAEVVMFRGAKPPDNPGAFDARDVKANLEKEIKPSKEGGTQS